MSRQNSVSKLWSTTAPTVKNEVIKPKVNTEIDNIKIDAKDNSGR